MCNRSFVDIDYFKRYFKYIATTDVNDAVKNGFLYVPGIHSIIEIERGSESDISFVGASKNRGELIIKAYEIFKQNGYDCDFTIVGLSNENVPEDMNTNRIPYKETLKREINSKCIFEMCTKGQMAFTQRALEAIMYNRYLITNSTLILESKFYSPDRVFYYENVDELKHLRIPNESIVQYQYNGEFSPLRLLEKIVCLNENIQK